MHRRRFLALSSAALLLMSCGMTGGVHPTDTLIYPGATEVDMKDVQAALAAELSVGIDQYLKDLPKPSRSRMYKVPDATTYAEVKTFYNDGLSTQGYAPFDTIKAEGDTLNYVAWYKGVSIVVIGMVENTADSGAYILVVELP